VGAFFHLGFDRNWILTIPRPPLTHVAPNTKFQQNRTILGRITAIWPFTMWASFSTLQQPAKFQQNLAIRRRFINDSTNFHLPSFRSDFCAALFSEWSGPSYTEFRGTWGNYRRSRVCLRFQIRCSDWKRGTLKGNSGRKSEPNFTHFITLPITHPPPHLAELKRL